MSKKNMSFLESPATLEEDSYSYRIEWDNLLSSVEELLNNGFKNVNHGPGSRNIGGFDQAWELFNDLRRNPDFIGVRLIQIDKNGNEEIRNK